MAFEPNFLATAIGSMPHEDPERAVDIVLDAIPDAPIWPQLTSRGLYEQMEIQYSEGMPRRVVDQENSRLYFDTTGDYSDDLASFYEAYMMAMDPDAGSGDFSSMAISPEYAAGLYALEARLKKEDAKRPFVKVQVTGPCTFALTVVDEGKRAMFYNDEFRDVIVKALAMKCRWQIRKFQPYAEQVICFIDEPVLSGFGSSTYVSVQRDDVVGVLAEVIEAIHADNALAGVHCCGNTDWSLLVDAGADIINFDAYGYGETVLMYGEKIRAHLEAGKALAWGVVPTSEEVRAENVESLSTAYARLANQLAERCGVDREVIARQTIITPSCGTGSMSVPDAEMSFKLSGELAAALKEKQAV